MNKLLYLEISRGIAALLVVFHHVGLSSRFFLDNDFLADLFIFGHHGIDYFFVLSGFIIYYVHSNDSRSFNSVKNYILKRIIRIYPIFLLISSILLIAYIQMPEILNREDNIITFTRVIKSFLLLPSLEKPILPISWTLIHEIFFYFTFILIILNKRIGFLIFILWVILIFFYNIFLEKVFPYSFYLNSHNFEFLLGIVTAYLFKSNKFLKIKYFSSYILYFGLFIFILNGINTNYNFIYISSFYQILLYGVSSSFILFGLVLLREPIYQNKLFKIFLLLGASSYSIYIIHNPLLSVLFRIMKKTNLEYYLNDILIFLLFTSISIVVGILLHLIIEKPILKFLRKRLIKSNI